MNLDAFLFLERDCFIERKIPSVTSKVIKFYFYFLGLNLCMGKFYHKKEEVERMFNIFSSLFI